MVECEVLPKSSCSNACSRPVALMREPVEVDGTYLEDVGPQKLRLEVLAATSLSASWSTRMSTNLYELR